MVVLDTKDELKQYFEKHGKTRQMEAHAGYIHSVAWNCTGQKLASGSLDKTVCTYLFDGSRLNNDITFKGHQEPVDQLTWNPIHPDLISSAGTDKTVRIWDARTKKCITTIGTKGENLNICWSPDGTTIAVGNKEDLVSFVDVRTHKIVANEQFKEETNEFAWDPSGTHIFFTNGQGQIVIYSWPEMKHMTSITAHPSSSLLCIDFDKDGKHFAVGSNDALVSLWDVETLVNVRSIGRLEWPIRSLSFSYDGKLLASGSEDLVIDIAHVESAEQTCDVKCEGAVYTLAWHPTEYILASATDDRQSTSYRQDYGIIKLFGFRSSD